jgi:hypothetical protein
MTAGPGADDDLDAPRKPSRARMASFAVVFFLGLAVTGAWAYTRWVMKKSDLGGSCKWGMQCKADAPKCMRPSEDEEGVCSKPCELDGGDCAPSVKCVKVELEEIRDERGVPFTGGYCFPQTFLDARKKKKDAGAPLDSWIDVPSAVGQIEGEITYAWQHSGVAGETKTFLVKGTLVRTPAAPGARTRTIVDASTMRTYTVDDERKSFSASALEARQGDAKVTKTGKKDKVADQECDVWQIDDGRLTRDACVLAGAAFVDPQAHVAHVWARELAVRSALPLRVIEVDGKGHEGARMTAQRFDRRGLDAGLFAIPKSYKNNAAK